MSRLYEDQHRALQDRFESRPMADRIEQIALKTEIGPEEQAFIESRDFFFLTTVDSQGRPTVSYKGGAPGFVRVVDQTHLMFPSYDGNGMYLSMWCGNVWLAARPPWLTMSTRERTSFGSTVRIRADASAQAGSRRSCSGSPSTASWKNAEVSASLMSRSACAARLMTYAYRAR